MIRNYVTYFKAKLGSKKGQGMVEYGLILALVAIVVIGALTLVGGQIGNIFNNVASTLGGTAATTAPAS